VANPRGNLAGISDREIPGWRERVIANVRHVQAEKSAVRTQGRRKAQIQVFFDPEFLSALHIVAKGRGMSIGAYARRALAKQIAKDMGVDWTLLLKHCARVTPYGSRPPGRAPNGEKTADDGLGYGDWRD
jgi:hypothetical protein